MARLRDERHEMQLQLEKEKDRMNAGQEDLDEKKRSLMQKRIELEKQDALKDLTIRQMHDVSPIITQTNRS